MSWISRVGNVVRSRRMDAEIDEELQFHIDERTNELMRSGLGRSEAELTARRQLGNLLKMRESSHDVKSAAWMESLGRDFRFGMRLLRKHRVASLAAVASLALAIGACTAAFSLIDALILRPLPVPEPNRLINLAQAMPSFFSPDNQSHESDFFSFIQFQDLRDAARGRAELFAMSLAGGFQPATFDDAGGALENVRIDMITGRGFDVLGVKPSLGRLIQPDDDARVDGHAVAVLSYPFWKRRYGGNANAIGRWVTVGRQQYQIIGVADAKFGGVQPGYLTDFWLPLQVAGNPRTLASADDGRFAVWGRLNWDGPTADLRETLQARNTNFRREMVRNNPPRNLHGAQLQQMIETPLRIRSATTGRTSLFRAQFQRPLWFLALICGLLLLIACSNVANLLLARASARDSEMALRTSLGAGRGRLLQQMLIESGQLAAAACILAILFAAFVAPFVVGRLGSTEFPAWLDVNPNYRTISFTIGLSLITTILFGIVPALRASSTSPSATLKWSDRQHSSRLRGLRVMLAVQVGFSVALLFLSGLLLLSFRRLIGVDLGFTKENVVLFDLEPRDRENHQRASPTELLDQLRRLPAVVSASATQQRPMGGDTAWIMTPVVRMPGKAVETVRPTDVQVSEGFFRTLKFRWIAGRDFLPEELESVGTHSVIVNQAFVDKYLSGRNPVGLQFEKLTDDPDPVPQQIVGVVGNALYNNLRETVRPTIYSPTHDIASATLNIRTASSPAPLTPWLRESIERAAPAMRVRGTILLASQIDNTMISERLLALLSSFFACVALLLAAVGLYGVINYAAVRRTREIGIRIALGARASSVVRLVLAESTTPVLAGIVAGIAGGLLLARYVSKLLFGVAPTDLSSLVAPVLCLLVTCLLAALPPARRASRIDPVVALRYE